MYREVIRLVDEGRKVGVYLDFSRVFDVVFYDIMTDSMTKSGLHKQRVGKD